MSENENCLTIRERAILEKAKKCLLCRKDGCSTKMLAMEVGSNTNSISKIFSKATGRGPMRWIREHKLGLAREMIYTSEIDITFISYDFGYKNPSTFSTVYRRHFGVSPSQDRKRCRVA